MKEVKVSGLREFMDVILEDPTHGFEEIFRGQDRPRNLLPSVVRRTRSKDSTNTERHHFYEFKRKAFAHGEARSNTDLDLLIKAQHHGMKTRLLDWTANPLTALWFACQSKNIEKAYVYRLIADDHLHQNPYSQDPFGRSKTLVVKPRHSDPRLIAQDGWFTLHQYSNKWKKFVPLERNKEIKKSLTEIEVQVSKETIVHLNYLGVNYERLFPDLEGLSKQLNWEMGF